VLNPLVRWEPGTLVRYHGSLTDLHGTYRAWPCDCLYHDDDRMSVSFNLTNAAGNVVVACVRPRSITPPEEQHVESIRVESDSAITVRMTAATHLTLTPADRVSGITPTGKIIRSGIYKSFQNRANTITANAREYEAIVRWDGDDYDSPVSFGRLTTEAVTAPHDDFHLSVAATWRDWTGRRT